MKKNKWLRLGYFIGCILTLQFLFISPVIASDLSSEQIQQVESIIDNFETRVEAGKKIRLKSELSPKGIRIQHEKSNGLLEAEFSVSDNIPEELRQGLFSQPGSYRAWVRFSNGNSRLDEKGQPQSDWVPDVRGMAIKVLETPGKSLVDDKLEQDFVLINHPVFFASDLQNFMDVFSMPPIPKNADKAEREAKIKAYIATLPTPERKQALGKSLGILSSMNSPDKLDELRKGASPLNLTYWSTTPFKLGDENVKYIAIASKNNPKASAPDPENPNFLRSAMVEQLNSQDATFDLAVQVPENSEELPINDATVNWDVKSKSIVVATLRIPQQTFDSPKRRKLDEELSFTPWHALPEHQPLGEINLARKPIYQELSQLRHHINNN